jgi:hypothetical protein
MTPQQHTRKGIPPVQEAKIAAELYIKRLKERLNRPSENSSDECVFAVIDSMWKHYMEMMIIK